MKYGYQLSSVTPYLQSGVKYIFAEQERWDRDTFDCAAASFRHLQSMSI